MWVNSRKVMREINMIPIMSRRRGSTKSGRRGGGAGGNMEFMKEFQKALTVFGPT